jgi:Flp pilus assembly protein TadG
MIARKTVSIQSHRKPRRKRLGAYTLEMAVGLPLVFLTILSSFELLKVTKVRHAANQGAYEAARRLVIPGATTQEAVDAANFVLNTNGLEVETIQVNPPAITRSTREVTVELSLRFRNEWSFARLLGGRSLQTRCTLMHEYASMFLD